MRGVYSGGPPLSVGAYPLPLGKVPGTSAPAATRGHLCWIVRESQAPRRWVAEACMSNGGDLVLTYEVNAADGGAEFVRTLEYRMPNLAWKLLDTLVLRRRIERESVESLRRLKEALER